MISRSGLVSIFLFAGWGGGSGTIAIDSSFRFISIAPVVVNGEGGGEVLAKRCAVSSVGQCGEVRQGAAVTSCVRDGAATVKSKAEAVD